MVLSASQGSQKLNPQLKVAHVFMHAQTHTNQVMCNNCSNKPHLCTQYVQCGLIIHLMFMFFFTPGNQSASYVFTWYSSTKLPDEDGQ